VVCDHLKHLYQLCLDQKIRLSSSELVHFVCRQCDSQDTCPSNLMDYEDDAEPDSSDTCDSEAGHSPADEVQSS